MSKRLRRNKGFTLIELIIVMGIIGILSAVAVPLFMEYQGRAKQSEAKVNLTGIYSSETTYTAEYNHYATTFSDLGFTLAGDIARYFDFTITAPVTPPPDASWPEGAWIGAHGVPGNGPAGTADKIHVNSLPGVDAVSFTALAVGSVEYNTSLDSWTINSDKILSNDWDGVVQTD